ncbi:MAG: Na+/H+ antiporter NhaC family protein [Synergistaceae bacterium]|nr:Na+/H+ antiporter NhaC family protein [Synergistaceae bacterium]
MERKMGDKRVAAILSITIVFFFLGILAVRANSTVMLITAGSLTICLGILSGVKWEEFNEDICQSISTFIPGILVIMAVGIVIGAWMISGTIPLMIYYGLKILSPSWFLPASLLICIIVSITTGTSWGTVSTVGIALMGVSGGLGIPLPYTAGAIVSGAIFGDKLSPLSDTTN